MARSPSEIHLFRERAYEVDAATRHDVGLECVTLQEFEQLAAQPNGPMWNTMLTIANKPRTSNRNAVMSVNDTGKWLAAWISPPCFIAERSTRNPDMNVTW